MILLLENGKQIRGDLIASAVLRSDLAPIPMTLEADIRAGDNEGEMDKLLAEGKKLSVSSGDRLHIVKSVRVAGRETQDKREKAAFRITALLESCLGAALVRNRAIIKENASLSAIYKAAGASVKAVEADFPVPRFYCPVGETPTFHIARTLQEEGGVVRWKNSRLQFIRLPDLFRQKAAVTLPDNAADNVDGGFMERHQIPWFFSLDDFGGFLFGNRGKSRTVRFSPFKNTQRLRSMTRCLVHRKTMKINYDGRINAGDLIAFAGGLNLVVVTVAHVFKSGTDDGGKNETYSRMWLGALEE
ncbi:MAG: hypothetical protein NC211_03595 [Alistipes senegalensis]|nr:hypothetical protein [Oxalobacter formigenes]MCM1280902.1 hypothetical protein [Alistipes senegalensis]